MITFTAAQATALTTVLATASDLQLATANNRAEAFKKLTATYHAHKSPPMADFKVALSTALKMRFGKETAETKGFVVAPQIVKDWSGRISQATKLGIKTSAMTGKTESLVKAQIVTEKAVAGGIDRAKLKAKAGVKPTLKSTQDAVKALGDPNKASEIAALKTVIQAIAKTMESLTHTQRMTYMATLVTQTKSKPLVEIDLAIAS